ncbi:MAG: bifunctional 5,10-methylenetetrahydrofolate dehydrogenase/5,10-methenyltetrahydrofolate cyclohydrolase [Pyrinomonadaceae bacterium]
MLIVNEEKRSATVLDGAHVAAEIKREVADEAARLKAEHNCVPGLAAVRVGNDPASAVYVRNKVSTSAVLGLRSEQHELPEETTTEDLLAIVKTLNARDDVDGILVQLPLPRAVEEARVLEAIDPAKDVDGFHPINVGRLTLERPGFAPCTPAGIIELLLREGIQISGQHACIVGRSHIVGRPLAQLLLQHDATITVCHSRTRDLALLTCQADILIAAVGRAGLIRAPHVKPGATVIDVGMNRLTDEETARDFFGEQSDKRIEAIRQRGYTLAGDVHFSEVEKVAGCLTPVPGGVGPLTVAMLMRNTLTAARRRRGLSEI